MTQFAAYDDMTIHAVAKTAQEARERAASEARVALADLDVEVSPISAALAEWIEANGWDGNRRSFAIADRVIDTTDKGRPFFIGERVEAGAGEDTGTVHGYEGDALAYVAWDSGVSTSAPVADLRPID